MDASCTSRGAGIREALLRAAPVVPSPIQVLIKLLRTVFPTRGQQVDVLTNVVQEEPLDHQYLTMIWAICVVEVVSIYLDILTYGGSTMGF